MDKIKDFDNFLDSQQTEEFYECCYNIMKNAYLAGYDFASKPQKKNGNDNVINLPK